MCVLFQFKLGVGWGKGVIVSGFVIFSFFFVRLAEIQCTLYGWSVYVPVCFMFNKICLLIKR